MDDRGRLLQRWHALKSERSSWISHWRELSELILPRSGQYVVSDRNRGDKRHNKILDSTPTRSLRVLAAGMMAGATSPARPWFRLTTSDPELDEAHDVKKWLSDVTRLMQMVFARSNTYRALHTMYEELGCFGTAANIIDFDFHDVIHNNVLTIGSYAVASNGRGEIDTLYREFDMTVHQLVSEYGYDRCSSGVQHMFDNGSLDKWVTVIHAIEPRREDLRDIRKRDSGNMRWRSVTFEYGTDEGDKVLRDSGYRHFPALCPRWAVSGGDIYGNSPAMEALGDIKQLRQETLRKAQCIDYQTKPPLQVPTSLKDREIDMLPGGVTFVDAANPTGGVRSMFDVRLDLNALREDMERVRRSISECFYADLFLMLANSEISRMTATEVAERHEEKLLMLGPVLERMHNELLDPLIELTFSKMVEAGMVPPAPEALQGRELNVEFVSMLAQSQRAIGVNGIDRFVGSLGAIANFKPEVLDKFDADKWADAYADMLGIDPELIVAGDQVAFIRQQRAEQQAQMQQMAALQQGADAASKLGKVKTDSPNALTDIVDSLSGYEGAIGEGI